ncbi:GNAT family N-acetyltransferase [Pseudomonas sp. LP_7_YM]|uniref:GNAT family N-acetyltransferase n=1 Tax=Pseudomonas sp. LP_7_YM TaxID=2485137 RepID=UPI0010DA25E1|nr:GNAT family N-acetyltransferase [Pseudomonas sp. LP_7_YM]TDV70263.1 acetyltransferase (GNAT) family protein [Pseudomonas sp. LP_7_YM]
MQFQLLPALQRPLLAKFYKAQRSGMRARGEAQMWVAKDKDIVAALCMTPVTDGRWLSGLFVAPDRRGQGIARALIEAALGANEGSVWLFCDPHLLVFYQRAGFIEADDLPEELRARLTRYRQTKALLALVRA